MKFDGVAIFTGRNSTRLLSLLLLLVAGAFLTGCNVNAFAQKATPEEEYQNQIDQSRLRWASTLCSYLEVPETTAEIMIYRYGKLPKATRDKIMLKQYTRENWQKNCINDKLSYVAKMRMHSDERKTAQLLAERLEAENLK